MADPISSGLSLPDRASSPDIKDSTTTTTHPIASSIPSPPTKRAWHRTTLFNAHVIGLVGFLAPGMWNAMSSLGAGGAESPYLVNAGSALTFGLMGALCLLGGPLANRIGPGRTLFLGAIGYPVYSAGLYCNNRFGTEWVVLLGATLCGLSAGLFWAAEGAVALGYPEPAKRGRYLNIWLYWRTGGPLLGGLIVLCMNHSASEKAKGKVGWPVYIVFIALQCLAAPVALALSPPAKVQRSDGSAVVLGQAEETGSSWAAELRALGRAMRRREVLLLLPAFWASYFNQYSGNFETYYFGVRARALIGFLINFATLLGSQLMSVLLDHRGFAVTWRVRLGFLAIVVLHVVAWVYAWVVQSKYVRHPPVYDWTDPGFTEGFFVLILWELARQSLQNWLYYLLASTTAEITELARYAGILRGQESFAQAVSFGLNTRDWTGGRVPMAVNTILLGLAVFPTWLVVRDLNPVGVSGPTKDSDQLSNEGATMPELGEAAVLREEEREKYALGRSSIGGSPGQI